MEFITFLLTLLSCQLAQQFSLEKVKEMLADIVKSCDDKAKEQQVNEGYIKLERGFATIPLPGIDVPFHSRYLWAGVMPFRACKRALPFDDQHIDILDRSIKED